MCFPNFQVQKVHTFMGFSTKFREIFRIVDFENKNTQKFDKIFY